MLANLPAGMSVCPAAPLVTQVDVYLGHAHGRGSRLCSFVKNKLGMQTFVGVAAQVCGELPFNVCDYRLDGKRSVSTKSSHVIGGGLQSQWRLYINLFWCRAIVWSSVFRFATHLAESHRDSIGQGLRVVLQLLDGAAIVCT